MKLQEINKTQKKIGLMGLIIDKVQITPDTRNQIWRRTFECSHIGLTSLVGAPSYVIGNFYCEHNKLTSLEGAPLDVDGDFWCDNNLLTTLEGAPKKVNGRFLCSNNKLTSLDGAPKEIGGYIDCNSNKLTNLKDIHKHIKSLDGMFYCNDNPITSHVLGLLLIEKLSEIDGDGDWYKIINKYLRKGRKGMIDCQNELIEAGLEEFAQL